jgi:hypothetical protein
MNLYAKCINVNFAKNHGTVYLNSNMRKTVFAPTEIGLKINDLRTDLE